MTDREIEETERYAAIADECFGSHIHTEILQLVEDVREARDLAVSLYMRGSFSPAVIAEASKKIKAWKKNK